MPLNKVVLIGRLTKDPDVRYTQTGKVFCSFTLAVDRPFSTQGEHATDFIPIILWSKQAEIAGNNCTKGNRLAVEGRLQIRTYDDKDGQKHWVTEVVGDRIEFVENKKTSFPIEGEEVPFD